MKRRRREERKEAVNARMQRCARHSDWCDGRLCAEYGVDCPHADPPPAPRNISKAAR